MRGRTLTFRFVALLVSLLIVYPTFFAFFVQSSSFSDGLRTSFLLFKQPLLAILAMVLFFLFAKSSLHNDPLSLMSLSRWREFLGFFIAGTFCLVLSSSTQIDLNQILNSGISIHNNKVHWDAHRWGGVPFLSESDPVGEQYLWVHTPDQRLRKEVRYPIPSPLMGEGQGGGEKTTLKWYGIWRDGNRNGVLDDHVWLSVDGQRYDVTEEYRGLAPESPAILELRVPSSKPLHLILEKTGTSDSTGWVAQATYLSHQTSEWKPDPQKWQETQFEEAMVWVAKPNPWYFSLLFKLGYCLRWLGMGLLLLAFLGRGWVVSVIRQSPWMAGISLMYAPLVLLLGLGIRQSWPWLAQGIGWSLYGLLKLLPFAGTPFIKIPDPTHIAVGTEKFAVNIVDTCSGIESLGLFIAMYLGLVLFNHRHLRLVRSLLLLMPGVIGMYAVNLLRIYLLFGIGAMGHDQSVVDLFHTYLGMFFFVVYFLWFWQISQEWLKKPNLFPKKGFCIAPAMATGCILFILITGHELLLPSQQTKAAPCDGHRVYFYSTTSSSLDQCTGLPCSPLSGAVYSYYDDYPNCTPEVCPPYPASAPPKCGCYPFGPFVSQNVNCPEFPPFFVFLFSFIAPWFTQLLRKQ